MTDNGSSWTDQERSVMWDDCVNFITEEDRLEADEAIERAQKEGKNVKYLLIGWPPGDDETAYGAIKTFSENFPDNKIIYIGTTILRETPKIGSNSFYDHFKRIDDDESYDDKKEVTDFKNNVSDTYITCNEDEVQLGVFETCDNYDCDCKVPVHTKPKDEEEDDDFFILLDDDDDLS